jgi:hypothetical protein
MRAFPKTSPDAPPGPFSGALTAPSPDWLTWKLPLGGDIPQISGFPRYGNLPLATEIFSRYAN